MPFDRDLIEARLALNLIASCDMPQIALDALEAGLDGKATRRLAILENPAYFEVADVLPSVMRELGLDEVPIGEAAVRVARGIAKDILDGGHDPLRHLRDFESLWVRSDFAREISALGTLYDDVFIAQVTNQSDEEIRNWVKSILQDFAR